ncbi:nuclear transport factor 2 family protein [Pseudarthrobacter sp. fls2-241-R2A-168]|uniref:nuclear transport factor 2 family protein n=1 Tax=Pseudarthrobacter sp. fls2-241-R2A-168 TaxID=3040304 RepID=UPI00255789C6|nr:nuclear transport factor 2 family protein [Pseudarthrobacter sp. fls2-241-R2A-168]
MTNPTTVVDAYFAGVKAGDASAVAALFAPDAQLINAKGTLRGADAIQRMYENGLAPGAMTPSPWPPVVNGDHVAVEIDLDVNGVPLKLGDFFTIRDGKIQTLTIYSLTPTDAGLFDKVGVDPAQ